MLSPATERIDRGRKLRIYAEVGVAHAWLLNPIERTLEVLRLREGASRSRPSSWTSQASGSRRRRTSDEAVR